MRKNGIQKHTQTDDGKGVTDNRIVVVVRACSQTHTHTPAIGRTELVSGDRMSSPHASGHPSRDAAHYVRLVFGAVACIAHARACCMPNATRLRLLTPVVGPSTSACTVLFWRSRPPDTMHLGEYMMIWLSSFRGGPVR